MKNMHQVDNTVYFEHWLNLFSFYGRFTENIFYKTINDQKYKFKFNISIIKVIHAHVSAVVAGE